MSLTVDPKKIDELASEIKRLKGTLENGEVALNKEIRSLINETNTQYNESYVRAVTSEMDGLLDDIRKLAASITTKLNDKYIDLNQTAHQYRQNEETIKKLSQKSTGFTLNANGNLNKTSLYTLSSDVSPLSGDLSLSKKYSKEVEKLQKRLNELGYSLEVDGYFGKLTQQAVNDYKNKYGLGNKGKYEGVVGEQTWLFLFGKLNGTLSIDNKEYVTQVRMAQIRLKELGYEVDVTGIFDQKTLKAVNEFKKKNKLGNTGEFEGKIGPQTWGVLFGEGAILQGSKLPSSPVTGTSAKELEEALVEKNKKINNIKGSKEKIIALRERNQWLLPYIHIDQSNTKVIDSLKKFQIHYSNNKQKYENVSKKTGVPPELIAAIHWREGSGNFNTYLHNGDPLGKKTVNVPKDILFYNWEEAAVHAINQKKQLKDNLGLVSNSRDIAAMMAFAEFYNGTGYLKHNVNSVYIFSGTNIPLNGKYYADGKFTYGPVKDYNPGMAIMLMSLMDLNGTGTVNGTNPPKGIEQSNKSSKGVDDARDKVLELAKQFEGKVPYRMDEKRPMYMDPLSPPKEMDCSDFTSAIYRTILRDLDIGKSIDIGANTRTQINAGLKVWTNSKETPHFNIADLKKGDLILFTAPNSTQVGHVGFYLGDGKFIHESGTNSKGGNVKISDLKGYWLTTQKPIAIRRIIGDDGNVYGQDGKKVGTLK